MSVKKFAGAAALISLGFASSAFAEREFADIYTECGIGAMIAPNNAAVAAVTNVTWDLGTTAISSNATSEDQCKGGGGKSAALIYEAYPSIEKNLANGEGEYLTALLNVAGVAEADHASVIAELRPAFAEVVGAADYSERSRFDKAETLYNLLHASI